ncbi:MAG: glycosyltransferase family 4 protein [Solirubrobacterales bacterium]|nr:glycosyltransferase family 4 protein [Solirubrobacterales bacterium]
MPPEGALQLPLSAPGSQRPEGRPLRVVDVALFYGQRGGGISTYLQAKGEYARRTGALEHHLLVPDQHRSLVLAASNGYRLPLGSAGMLARLRELEPDVVLLHDPYWSPRMTTRTAHAAGAAVVAVHHSSVALNAAALPGPQEVYKAALRRWYRRAYLDVDAVMSVVDPTADARRDRTLALRLGLDPAFNPRAGLGVARGDHVLYAGRLSREKGVRELLDAAALAEEPWPLLLIGTGPAEDMLRDRAAALGISERVRFRHFEPCRASLAREFAAARCVALPGAHETFGVVALEAAACGASVVTASTTPSAKLLGGSVETFAPDDPRALAGAIRRARTKTPAAAAAKAIADAHSWDAVLSAELADLSKLVSR